MFLDFVFDRETTVASGEGWVWGVDVFYPTSSEKLRILTLSLDCFSSLVHVPFPSGVKQNP